MKQISLLLLVSFFSLSTFAQVDKEEMMEAKHESHKMKDHDDHEARAMIYADKVATRLSLNLEKKEKIRLAHLQKQEDLNELKAELLAGEKSEMNDQKKKIQNDFTEEMKDILDDAQYAKWKQMHDREMKMNEKAYKMKKNKDSKKMQE
jgi:HD-GYP domain-containing protein (c-di-GMP phosphodiesterase class II)